VSDLRSESNELNSLKFKAFPMSFESAQTLEVESHGRRDAVILLLPFGH
jgi:hypothetical protein